jgi:hypothetical protein
MRIRHLLAATAALALAACDGYGAPNEVVYGVVVATQPKASADFASYATYFIDTTVTVTNDGRPGTPVTMASSVRDAIAANMEAAGFNAAASAPEADVGLQLSFYTASIDYYYSGGYCDIYYGWYGCYYPPVYAGSYSVGTAVLAMVDLTVPPATGQEFPSLWGSFMYGVLDGLAAYNQAKLVEAVNRAFDQSPYLQAAP